MNIQHAVHTDEIQICACSMLNHLLQPSHELNHKKEKDHLSHTLSAYKLAFGHLDPPCPVMGGEFFTVSQFVHVTRLADTQNDQLRGCQLQLDTHSTLLILQVSIELTFMRSAHTKQK